MVEESLVYSISIFEKIMAESFIRNNNWVDEDEPTPFKIHKTHSTLEDFFIAKMFRIVA